MKERMQNESSRLDQSESRVEPKGMTGLQTSMGIIENGLTEFTRPKDGLLEFILSPANLNAAYKKVKGNKGSGGIDGMSTEDLLPYLKEHGSELVASLREGTYKPNPVRRVEIPKANGKKRGLGIPTVVDRVVQQAISQVLEVLYEPQFSEMSYGFRPHRSAHKALLTLYCGSRRTLAGLWNSGTCYPWPYTFSDVSGRSGLDTNRRGEEQPAHAHTYYR